MTTTHKNDAAARTAANVALGQAAAAQSHLDGVTASAVVLGAEAILQLLPITPSDSLTDKVRDAILVGIPVEPVLGPDGKVLTEDTKKLATAARKTAGVYTTRWCQRAAIAKHHGVTPEQAVGLKLPKGLTWREALGLPASRTKSEGDGKVEQTESEKVAALAADIESPYMLAVLYLQRSTKAIDDAVAHGVVASSEENDLLLAGLNTLESALSDMAAARIEVARSK